MCVFVEFENVLFDDVLVWVCMFEYEFCVLCDESNCLNLEC